ncbi:helix-turn-helix DNA-binding domain protein [Streptomyces phage TunaTartare]|uniref:Helix-turn-helix DNA-binding domain protein n=1 Tax=Streptomyces phage TunaTartare TaxID=2848887 RepID=A0A8F2E6Y5_9CAUD|nr:helix-turn-helix DNA-binding domain protein [Streptomyces phage TunaTartare]QWT29968.1 helix-turn-helix DNA-binding domain protein [Streptomyces phage TunaTartare]
MATSAKKYLSKKWLHKRYVLERKSLEDIAAECNTSKMTISRYINKFQIKRL